LRDYGHVAETSTTIGNETQRYNHQVQHDSVFGSEPRSTPGQLGHREVIERREVGAETTFQPGPDKPKMMPMTPIQASSTIVNLVLATGPFSYPQGFVQLGPFISMILLVITCFISYMTATFMIEAVSIANAEDTDRRRDSMFGEICYASPVVNMRYN